MGIYDVINSITERRRVRDVENELRLREMKQRDYAFEELRVSLAEELEDAIYKINSSDAGTQMFYSKATQSVGVVGSETILNIVYVPLFWTIRLEGAGRKHTLSVQVRRNDEVWYRREDGAPVAPEKLKEEVSRWLKKVLDKAL